MQQLSESDEIQDKVNHCKAEMDKLCKELMAEEFLLVGQQEVGVFKYSTSKGMILLILLLKKNNPYVIKIVISLNKFMLNSILPPQQHRKRCPYLLASVSGHHQTV